MSIIEKAVDKIGDEKESAAAKADTITASGPQAQGAAARSDALAGVQRRQYGAAHAGSGSTGYVELPFEDLHQRGILVPTVPRSPVAEAFRNIKRPLLNNVHNGSVDCANLIMVTSALQGEGKTFTSLSLAMSIAMEQDKRVLFVDADVAKASAGELLGLDPDAPGLIDILEQPQLAVSDAIVRTNVDKLSVFPAGTFHERCNELLASSAMRDLALEMSHRYPDRVVVFDSPPVLLTNEASVLASLMGQIVFVVQAERTPNHVVSDALERISEDKMVGMVLNQARARGFSRMGYGYGYGGYSYGYGYGTRGGEAGGPSDALAGS